MDISNRIRYYHYIAGVFTNQQTDLLCSACKAFTNSVNGIREDLDEFIKNYGDEISTMPEKQQVLLYDAKNTILKLHLLEDAVGQKKAGNCKMPEGVCFIKTSKAIFEKIFIS